jgi:hypothetical protein
MSGLVTAALVLGAGAAAYGGYSSNQASKKAAGQMRESVQYVDPVRPNAPQTVDYRRAVLDALNFNRNNFTAAADLARMTNRANVVESQRQYRSMQPYFDQLQRQLGQNALSYSQGELPADVVESIGKAAAQRGLQGGFGMGARGAAPGSALSSLNLRNLGLTSLDLSKFGTNLAMQAGLQSKQLSPGLVDPLSLMVNPNQAVNFAYQNAGIQNEADRYWNQLQNRAVWDNTSAMNTANQNAINTELAGQLASAQQIAQAGQSLGGVYGQYATNQVPQSPNYYTSADQISRAPKVAGFGYNPSSGYYRLT